MSKKCISQIRPIFISTVAEDNLSKQRFGNDVFGIRSQNDRTLHIRPSCIEALGKAELLDYSHNGHLYSVRLYEDFYTVFCDGNDDRKYNYGVSAAFEK